MRDPRRDEQELRVGPVEQWEQPVAERLLTARAGRTVAARRRVCGHDAASGRDVDPAELVPEPAGRWIEQDRVTSPERLRVGAVGERHLDLDENVARIDQLGPGDVLHAHVSRAVEDQCPH